MDDGRRPSLPTNSRQAETPSPDRRRHVSSRTPPGGRAQVPARLPLPTNNSSIRIRRLTSSTSSRQGDADSDQGSIGGRSSTDDPAITGRRRSTSAPQRLGHHLTVPGHDISRVTTGDHFTDLSAIAEASPSGSMPATPANDLSGQLLSTQALSTNSRPRGLSDLHNAGSGMQATFSAGNAARTNRGLNRIRSNTVRSRPVPIPDNEYNEQVLGLLDLVDPEVQTLSTLTNVQNSLFVPDLGRLVNRRPTYDLTSRPSTARMTGALGEIARSRAGTVRSHAGTTGTSLPDAVAENEKESSELTRRASITSQMTARYYAVLPHGETLSGWTDAEIDELNDHVRHLLHSRREGFKRGWRGFKKYISKPLGLFVFIYAVLITLFGATWVIFLIGWIYVGSDRQSYAVNVIDNVLVALFAVMGDGLAPFRAVDTYHMCLIAHYHHLTWRLRKEKALPKLQDHNDLPAQRADDLNEDLEAGGTIDDMTDKTEFTVLTPLQQKRLQYHQAKFSKSHTFYKPHETATHHAFPLKLLVAVVVLLDCHSLFQIALGTCTWSIDYTVRPEALTATILSCSITCNIAAGILVSIGDKRTRKKEVLDRIFRQALTREAIDTMQQRHAEHERNNYDAIDEETEAEEGAETPREKRKFSREIPRITKTKPRASADMPRLSKEFFDNRRGATRKDEGDIEP